MDGNKDEAQKCFKIGQEALKLGNRTRALKFLTKAHRLDPNLPVQDLISSVQSQQAEPPPSNSAPPPETSSVRHRHNSNSDSSSNSSVYTEEQISIVRQIKRQKDYYEILGVERTCSAEDVRKAYRKLSLKVHPDKNKAPGAEEAFKSVSKAFQCLSNEESKKHYDLVGSEEEIVRERPHRGHYQQGFNGFYEAEFDADEIFRNFFFGGMPRGAGATTQFNGFSFRTGGGPSVRSEHGGGGFNVRALVQLLPILLVILLNFLPSSEPVYSFTKSYPYEYHFTTERGVNYYVRTGKFDEQYPPDSAGRERLERQVEREYFSRLAQNCRAELQRYQWGLIHETPHCEMLKQFEAAG